MSNHPNSIDSPSQRGSLNADEPVEISLVIPAYNEAAGIESLVRSAADMLEQTGQSYEIIVVNDGSTDDTGLILSQLSNELSSLKPVSFRLRNGQHTATYVGLRESIGEFIFLCDADLTQSLRELVKLYEVIVSDETCEVIIGIRSTRAGTTYRSFSSWMVTKLINRIGATNCKDPASPLRIYRRRTLPSILEADILAQNLPILTGLLGFRIREVPMDIQQSGRPSRYGVTQLINLLLLALLNFSAGATVILTLISLGILSTGIGVLGMLSLTLYGIVDQSSLSTNLLLLFVLLAVVGLQFSLMGAIAYKLERINANLRFRQTVHDASRKQLN